METTIVSQYADNDLLTVQEVAEFLAVSDRTVRNWISERGLPASRLSQRRTRVRFSDLQSWVDSQRHDIDLD